MSVMSGLYVRNVELWAWQRVGDKQKKRYAGLNFRGFLYAKADIDSIDDMNEGEVNMENVNVKKKPVHLGDDETVLTKFPFKFQGGSQGGGDGNMQDLWESGEESL